MVEFGGAVGCVMHSFPALVFSVTHLAAVGRLLGDYDSRVRCAAVSALQDAGVVAPGTALAEAAAKPLGGGSRRTGLHAAQNFGWRAAEYVLRAMPEEQEMSPEQLDAARRRNADLLAENRVVVPNEQHLKEHI